MIAGFSITSLLLILLAGIGAGFVGYAVGASSLVSYPALLAFGIPPVLANASNTVGVVGTGIGGVMGARKELKGQAVRSITYVVIGAFGGVAGAFLLLKLDPSVFEFAAPVLILPRTSGSPARYANPAWLRYMRIRSGARSHNPRYVRRPHCLPARQVRLLHRTSAVHPPQSKPLPCFFPPEWF